MNKKGWWWMLTILLTLIWALVIIASVRAWQVWDTLLWGGDRELILGSISAYTLLALFGTWVWTWGLRDKK